MRRLRVGSWGWFVALQLAAIVPVVIIGLTLQERLRSDRVDETLRDARTRAGLIADLAIVPLLPPGDLTDADSAQLQPALDRVVGSAAVKSQVLRVKVWDRTGRVVASDATDLTGQRFLLEDDVREALAGEQEAEVTTLQAAENAEERRFGRAVEVYTPLTWPTGETVGVLEVYLPYEELARDLAAQERDLTRTLALGLLAVVVAVGLLTSLLTARLRRRTARAEFLGSHDPLTGLLNRSAFAERLGRELTTGRPVAVVVLDLDGFRRVNDTLGHAGGDRLLNHVGQVLDGVGVAARTGPDEFALLLSRTTDTDVPAALEALREAVSQETVIDTVALTPVPDVGAALFPEHAATPPSCCAAPGQRWASPARAPGGPPSTAARTTPTTPST